MIISWFKMQKVKSAWNPPLIPPWNGRHNSCTVESVINILVDISLLWMLYQESLPDAKNDIKMTMLNQRHIFINMYLNVYGWINHESWTVCLNQTVHVINGFIGSEVSITLHDGSVLNFILPQFTEDKIIKDINSQILNCYSKFLDTLSLDDTYKKTLNELASGHKHKRPRRSKRKSTEHV
jgi:hypothetical protein